MELFQQSAHGGTFDVKTTNRLPDLQLMLHLRVIFQLLYPVNIYLYLPVLQNNIDTVVDMSDTALTQNIEFLITDIFGHIHIPLGRLESLWRKIECRITGNWFLRNQYATRMDSAQIGKILHQCANRKELSVQLTFRCCGNGIIGQGINFAFRKPVHLTQFTDDRLPLKGVHRPKQCRMFVAVPFKNILMNIVAIAPRKINVKIGGRASFGIDKTLKIEIQLNRIYIGYFQTISYNRIGSGATSHMVKTTTHRIADNIPGDQEIGRETEFIDDGQFVLHPPQCFRIVAITVFPSVKGELLKQ